jgi:Domain of unknown function (DUF3854)
MSQQLQPPSHQYFPPASIPDHIATTHWQEWQASGIDPDIIRANLQSFDGATPYEYLCYAPDLPRTNSGRLASHILHRYQHTEAGGWWCQGLDPLNHWEPMAWGCFKPDRPITNAQGKVIKYEHPLKQPTRAFFLSISWKIGLRIAEDIGHGDEYKQRFLQAYHDGKNRRGAETDTAKNSRPLDSGRLSPGNGSQDCARSTQYSSQQNSGLEVYDDIPVGDRATFSEQQDTHFWGWIQTKGNAQIVLVEGAKKAAALLSQGYAAIALPGVFNGRRVTRDESGDIYTESLIPELAMFAQADRPVVFCFDHDSKAKTIRHVNQAIAATGKLLEAQGCDVRVITLPGPEKGVDDFLVAQGAEAFATVYAAALPLNLWHWQGRKAAELTLTPTQIVCQKEFQPTNLPESGILVLASAKGTGKTKAIGELVKDATRVIALGHRIALMRNLCDRMDLDYRGDLDEFQGQAVNADGVTHRIGLCVDSLGKINPAEFVGAIVVIDEFMQILRHLFLSTTCNQDGKRPALLAKLAEVVRSAQLVVLADADAADVGIKYFQRLAGADTPIHLIRNDFQPEGFDVAMHLDPQDNAIVAQILADLQAGQKIFVATDSLNGSEALQELIKALKTDNRGLIINSKTSGDTEQRDFITHPNTEVHRYDWIIATPSLSTGVSIEVEHFDKVYGLFYGVVTDADAAQALNRVRANVPRVVWVAQQGKNFSPVSRSTIPSQILQTLKTKTDLNALVLKASLGCADTLLPELFNLVWENNLHLDLYAQLVAHSNQAMWTLRDSLLARLQWEGNQVTPIAPVKSDDGGGSPMKQARKIVKQAHYQAVAQAQILTLPEITQLERQEAIAPEDQRNIEKTHTAEFLAQTEVSAADVEFCTQYRQRLLQLEVLVYGSDLAVHRDVDAMSRQARWGEGFLPFDQPFYELKRLVRDRLGLLPYLQPGQAWSDDDLADLADRVRGHRQPVKTVLGWTIPEADKHASNGWIFQMMCQQLGLKVVSQRRGPRGAQGRYYTIDSDHYQQVMEILERRQQRRLDQLASELAAPLNPLIRDGDDQTVVTPPGLNQIEGGDYAELTQSNPVQSNRVQPKPAQSKPAQSKPAAHAIQPVSDRVKAQIYSLVKSLKLLPNWGMGLAVELGGGNFLEAPSGGSG